ncbi:tegument protein UL16 [Human betaherpesvirus 5]|nr:tegument protein UL16 [Human betaherpesvirus 5]APA45472.1 tegument protein UL16 [Human betaherpesvirus 5]APA45590.1 tegument protein UL16 [Human betaherpesvirus 5]
MAWRSGLCETDSRTLKQFLQEECMWKLVGKSRKHREYRAVACRSTIFSPEDDGSCILCQLLLLYRDGEWILCLCCNGRYQGHYGVGQVHRRRRRICHLPTLYQLSFGGPLGPASIDFLPSFSQVTSSMTCDGITPDVIYEVCMLVPQDEAKRILVKGHGAMDLTCQKAVTLGGAGAWLLPRPEGYTLFFYILCYDLFTSCGNRCDIPSMTRLMAAATACGQAGCSFCTDHEGHVDPTGNYVGCTPDMGRCLCYVPCGPMTQSLIHNDEPATFFCESDDAKYLCAVGSKTAAQVTLGDGLDYHIGVKDSEGRWLPVKTDVWDLVKVEEPVSRMIVCSCPVLKNLVH